MLPLPGTKELKVILDNAATDFTGCSRRRHVFMWTRSTGGTSCSRIRFSRLLEEGVIKFIGSTTENPYFSVNNAIISRVRNIYEFKRLETDEILVTILKRTLKDNEKGLRRPEYQIR